MLGLGVGVDYSLFIVSRYRALFDGGMDSKEAVARAIATSGGAVLFAGGTVRDLACSASSSAASRRSSELGYSAAIAVAVVIVASLTMLPAGPQPARPADQLAARPRTCPRRARSTPSTRTAGRAGRRAIGRHPLIAAVVGIVVLLVLALPVTQIELGAQDNGQMPDLDHDPPVLRRAHQGLRRRLQRAAAGRRRHQAAGAERPEVAQPAQHAGAATATAGQQQPAAIEQHTEQLEARGRPERPEQAQQEATQQVEAQGPSQSQQQQTQQQKEFLKSPAVRSAAGEAAEQDLEGATTSTRSRRPILNNAGTAAAFSAIPKSAPSAERTQDAGRGPARRRDPEGAQGDPDDRLRRRHDGRQHRPRRRRSARSCRW